jgi:3-methyladenine DNA glycosylase/8-oxoguanine DNA glycosylase
MSGIKRIGWHGVHGMQNDANGEYVLHSDHEAEVTRLRAEVEKYRKDAQRYGFLKDERTGSYGDGYTEPKEAHLCLEWQQGPWIRDGSNGGLGRPDVFPGWDSIVDEMMASVAEDEDDAEIDAAMGESA